MSTSPPMPVEETSLSEEEWAEWNRKKPAFVRWRERLRGNQQLVVGAVVLLAFVGAGIYALFRFGGAIDQLAPNYALANLLVQPGPQAAYPFGIMGGNGDDIYWALIQSTPIDLALVGGSILLAVVIGLFLGTFAALYGGWVDFLVTGITDVIVSVPPFFFVMVLFLGLQPFVRPPSFLLLFGLLYALVLWPYHARPVRARALQVVGEPYVESARAAGANPGRVLWRHVIPNSIYPLLAQVPVDVYNFLFVLTVFPFLACFGGGSGGLFMPLSPLPRPIYPEWGYLLATGACWGWSPLPQLDHWWMYTFPAATVVLFGLGVALFCDGAERFLSSARRIP